jgi:hypothetical protein
MKSQIGRARHVAVTEYEEYKFRSENLKRKHDLEGLDADCRLISLNGSEEQCSSMASLTKTMRQCAKGGDSGIGVLRHRVQLKNN